jgi:hypothetical protein
VGTVDETNAADRTRSRRGPDRGRESSAISRLEETVPRRSPVRSIIESTAGPGADDPQIGQLKARLTRLERRQLELVSAQRKTNATLRRLNRWVGAQVRRPARGEEDRSGPAQSAGRERRPTRHQSMWRQRGDMLAQLALSLIVVSVLAMPAILGFAQLADERASSASALVSEPDSSAFAGSPTPAEPTGQLAEARQGTASMSATATPDDFGRPDQVPATTSEPRQEACEYVAGIAALVRSLGRDTVGECLENERTNAANGNQEQVTTKGLLFWLKGENVAAFTNGATTWYACPRGIERRPSHQPPPCRA